ncbi:uncharacterized protein LOC144356761 [Saccoglossus kowalevskii]
MDWLAAKEFCENYKPGGKLAVINTFTVHRRIRKYIRTHSMLKQCKGNGYWIGANDRDNEGNFFFTDNTTLTYDGWNTEKKKGTILKQPNNNVNRYKEGQDCVQIWRHPRRNPMWYLDDDYCPDLKSYICEWRFTTVLATTESPTTNAPTTKSVTTVLPTTESPTTNAPTTKSVTTVLPTTESPTTNAPTTKSVTTLLRTTESPTTNAPNTESVPQLPDTWTESNWHSSQAARCTGKLIVPNVTTNAIIVAMILTDENYNSGYWIGVSYSGSHFTDWAGQALMYTNWSTEPPPKTLNNTCVEIRKDGLWHIEKCSEKRRYICEEYLVT